LKGVKLRTTLTVFAVFTVSILAGCNGAAPTGDLLTVDFQQGQTLRYKFVSSRDIVVDWEPGKTSAKRSKDSASKSSESMEMVIAYTPVEVDPYGLTTVEATCASVKVKRDKQAQKDAVESLRGKSFMFTVNAAGKIEDYSQLDELVRELGKKAFDPSTKRGRIKNPDMISDFVAGQWFLWDSVSSIEKASAGVSPGQSWKSILSVPTPMVMREARDVTYTLEEVRESEKGRIAVIRSTYSHAESAPRSWPLPYTGRFQMRGRFGFLRRYKILDLQGEGEELFNIEAGRIEQYKQRYRLDLEASMPMGLNINPQIVIKQKLTMKLLED
jgi:hypothetical protein